MLFANKFQLGATILSSGAAFDADAQAFFTAVEGGGDTLTGTQKTAINTLVLDMKDAGVWTKMAAIYPIIGGTSSAHKWNLKDPRDLDAAYRLNFVGAPTHSANGVDWNGTTQYANTFLVPGTVFTQDDMHLSYYSRDNVTGGADMGARFTGGGRDVMLSIDWGGGQGSLSRINAYYVAARNAPTSAAGLHTVVRADAASYVNYEGAGVLQTVAQASTGEVDRPIFVAAINNGAPVDYSTRQCAFASVGTALTAGEVSSLNTLVVAYQTTLGRNV